MPRSSLNLPQNLTSTSRVSENSENYFAKFKGKTVAVFFGGQSPEHDVSIISALLAVIPPLKLLGMNVVPIYIAKTGDWFSGPELTDVKTYQTNKIREIMQTGKPLKIIFKGGLKIIESAKFGREISRNIDFAFPVLHGQNGEDGAIPAFLQLANIPFVGCDLESSAVAMNKMAKQSRRAWER